MNAPTAKPVVGVLLVGHAPLASALLSCAAHVFGGAPAQCQAIDVAADADVEAARRGAAEALGALDGGGGVLVLTDLFGATPANVVTQLAQSGKVEVVTGLNLPMLLRVLTYRDSVPLEGLVDRAIAGASTGVMRIAPTAPQQQHKTKSGEEAGASKATEATGERGGDAVARLHDQQ